MKMKKYRIVGELADNGQSITKFKKEIKKGNGGIVIVTLGTEQRYIKGINPIYNNSNYGTKSTQDNWSCDPTEANNR